MEKIRSRIAALVCAVAMAVGLNACGVNITSVGLPETAVMNKGDTLQMEISYGTEQEAAADAIAEAAGKLDLTWTSSDEAVATVDETGLVTAVGNGEADITITLTQTFPAATGETATAESAFQPVTLTAVTHVTVTTAVESITFDKTEGVLTVGNTHRIKATVAPDSASDPALSWTSSDESVATVDASGKVTARAAGSATIRAACGDVSAEYSLTVQNIKCSYCGQTGHTSASCPVKAADQKAAAQAAAQQQAAAQAAQQQAAAQSDPAPAPDPAPSGDSGSSGGDDFGQGHGGSLGGTVITGPGTGVGEDCA